MWLLAGLLPVTAYMIVASGRQPSTTCENAYRFILAKRIATCELEANQKRMSHNEFTRTQEYEDLANMLKSRGQTLYDVENELADRLIAGKGKL